MILREQWHIDDWYLSTIDEVQDTIDKVYPDFVMWTVRSSILKSQTPSAWVIFRALLRSIHNNSLIKGVE